MAGHVLRLTSHRPASVVMMWILVDDKRRIGRPVITWRKTLRKDLGITVNIKITWKEVNDIAMDCPQWSQAAGRCAEVHRRN